LYRLRDRAQPVISTQLTFLTPLSPPTTLVSHPSISVARGVANPWPRLSN